ncbi:hypothetical protein [Microbulbifer sp. GL-2]|uniref:hypothetical protein n=1 Tax=Microbulbifer sp. GL-2 TaxID=2591606 RepID=UPI00116216FF|nr:hypothetical protein [Microbulbifer sp. GL-2]BBM03563.1 hypothetical protein GL2_36370 [Microbulbifer sp. GL-2]
MKILKITGVIIGFVTIFLISSLTFSGGNMKPTIEVKLLGSKNMRLAVEVIFRNEMRKPFYLYEYYFCEGGVVLSDIFSINRIEGGLKTTVSYGGLMDFHNKNEATKDDFIKIEPNTEVSCEIIVSDYYDLRGAGEYELTYYVDNPKYRDKQPKVELKSNAINLVLPSPY